LLLVSSFLRSASFVQNNAMWRGVFSPALHWHCAVRTLGTRRPYKNLASPIHPVRHWISKALSAFCSPLCRLRMRFVGSVFVLIAVCLPRSVSASASGCIDCFAVLHLASQSRTTSGFSLRSHVRIGLLIHCSAHFLRLQLGVMSCSSLIRLLLRLCLCRA